MNRQSFPMTQRERVCVTTYKPPKRNIPDTATLCDFETWSFHTTDIGNISIKISVNRFSIAVDSKKAFKLIHKP